MMATTNPRSRPGPEVASNSDPRAASANYSRGGPRPVSDSPAVVEAYGKRAKAVLERKAAAATLEEARRRLHQAEERDQAAASSLASAAKDYDTIATADHSRPWGQRDDDWVGFYGGLLAYRAEHGNCLVHTDYTVCRGGEKIKLGKWVTRQRSCCRVAASQKGGLQAGRQRLLEDVGFDWGIEHGKRNKKWEDRYRELIEFKRLNGSCDVPQTAESQANNELARWVKHQREGYKRTREAGKAASGKMEERIRLLDEVGFSWRQHKFKQRKIQCEKDDKDDEASSDEASDGEMDV